MCGVQGLKIVGLKKKNPQNQHIQNVFSPSTTSCHYVSSFSTCKVTCCIHHRTIWSFFIVCGEQSDYNNVQTFLEQFILTDLVGLFMFVKNEWNHQL